MSQGALNVLLPRQIFLTKGVGRDRERLTAFELALRNARIARYNLVRVSSVFPPNCRLIGREKGLAQLMPGQIVHAVISEAASDEPHRLMAASIGLAIPAERSHYGYLSEHHSYGQTDEQAGDYAEDLAAQMLATILGVPFDPDSSWDARKEQWKISSEIVKTQNITQSAIGDREGRWTTVIAAAIFVP
ncbi:MAG: pyruvoyl-dependent arginine decarboxylase [Acidobacteriota bacterium]